MNISARTEYASRAVLALSLHWPSDKPLQINDIGTRYLIPSKFLTQILIQLKSYGIVVSTRGKNGGYLLARKPSEISLYDIISQFETNHHKGSVSLQEETILSSIYKDLNNEINNRLKTINFESLAEKQKSHDEIVTFQI